MSTSEDGVYDITDTIGGCGKFQVAIVFLINVCNNGITAGSILFLSFGIYNPGWACLDQPFDNNNMTMSEQLTTSASMASATLSGAPVSLNSNSTMPSSNGTFTWSEDCRVKESCQHLVYNTESSTVVTEWDLCCDRTWISSAMISIQMAGVLIGCYLSGHIGDRFGRKVCLYGFVALHGISHLAAAFPVHWQMYIVFLLLIGISIGGIFPCMLVYPLEFISSWWRGILVALPVWNLGCVIFAIITFILKDWRQIHITFAVMSLCVFVPVFWVPESVRWLTVAGKVEKAKKVIERIARINGRPCTDTSIIDIIADGEKKKMDGRKYTYLDLFKMPSIRIYTLKFGLMWILFASSYYALSFGVKTFSGNFYLNLFLFSIIDIPGFITLSMLVNKIGRRKSAFLYLFNAVAGCFGIVIVFFAASGQAQDIAILVLALISKVSILCAWHTISVFSLELHPTTVRSLHFGFVNCVARVGSILSPYLIPNDPSTLYVPYLILGPLYIMAIWVVWTLPETKGKALVDSDVKKVGNLEEAPFCAEN